MTKVRAKFECVSVQDFPECEQKEVNLMPVIEGSEENKSFAKYTPAGSLDLMISYETEASGFFEEGGQYYLDVSKAE